MSTHEESASESSMAGEQKLEEHPIFGPPLLAVSVHAACEELWRCQELEKVTSWLHLLHHAILRDRLDAYDPSEAFLCLQGAALRFHGAQETEQHHQDQQTAKETSKNVKEVNTPDSSTSSCGEHATDEANETDAIWSLWEESMWAAAALARVCVGPAWRQQLYQRRSWIHPSSEWHDRHHPPSVQDTEITTVGSDDPTPSEVAVIQDDLARSYSPMTSESLGNRSSRFDTWYPPIPEVLPAAMLRFAASAVEATAPPPLRRPEDMTIIGDSIDSSSTTRQIIQNEQMWLMRRKRLAEAQRELVLALCCTTAEEPCDSVPEWTIPSTHEPVASMLLFWLETATTGWPATREEGRNISALEETKVPHGKVPDKEATYAAEGKSHDNSDGPSTEKPFAGSEAPLERSERSSDRPPVVHPSTLSEKLILNSETPFATSELENDQAADESTAAKVPTSATPCELPYQDGPLWSDVVDIGALDWWYTLQIARATTDLVSAGWRPPPRSDIGAVIVLCLLDIAEKSIMLRRAELKCSPDATDREAREERLEAASSGAEAISALGSLGSRGLIPKSIQSYMVAVLCRLQVAAATEFNSTIVSPLGCAASAEESEQWELEKETLMTQRESCRAVTADLLWVLLAHQSSTVTSITALMRLIDVDMFMNEAASLVSSSGSSRTWSAHGQSAAIDSSELDAAAAVSVLGEALWGKTPEMQGIPSLRVFWLPAMDLFCKVASSIINNGIRREESPPLACDYKSVHVGSPFCPLSHCNSSSLSVALEIVVAFERLVDAELTRGNGLLTPQEWDAFALIFDQGIVPWLACGVDEKTAEGNSKTSGPKVENAQVYRRLRTELDSLLLRFGKFLDKCASFESSPFHLIMDDARRRQLHLLLLRKAAPFMIPIQATALALAVIRSWSTVGFLPHRRSEWCQTASDILATAFAVYEDRSFGLYEGYVYSPSVRIEALTAITHGGADPERLLPSSSAGPSGDLFQEDGTFFAASPLSLTRNMREQHLELINVSILPQLISILETDDIVDSCGDVRQAVLPVPNTSCHRHLYGDQHRAENEADELGKINPRSSSEVENDVFALRIFAVKLLGRLFCSASGERQQRITFLKLLRSVALGEGKNLESHHQKRPPRKYRERNLSSDRELSNIIASLDSFIDIFCLSLAAIRQIELCLCTPFDDLPLTHESIPSLVDALCSVIVKCGGEPLKGQFNNTKALRIARRILTMAALLPVCRLSISHDQRVVLLEKRVVTRHVPETLVRLFQGEGDALDRPSDRVNEASPFVVVSARDELEPGDDTRIPRQRSEKTIFLFHPIVSAIVFTLKSCTLSEEESDNTADEDPFDGYFEELGLRLRSTCFDALCSFVMSGVRIHLTDDLAAAMVSPLMCRGREYSKEEKRTRSRAIVALTEYFVGRSCRDESEGTQPHSMNASASELSLLNKVLEICTSGDQVDVFICCRGLTAILPALSNGDEHNGQKHWTKTICSAVLARLQTMLEQEMTKSQLHKAYVDERSIEATPGAHHDVAVALLSVLYDIFSSDARQAMSIESDQRFQTLDICHAICASEMPGITWYARLMALRCGAAAVSRMTLDEVIKASRAFTGNDGTESISSIDSRNGNERHDPPRTECDSRRLPQLLLDVLAEWHELLVELDSRSTLSFCGNLFDSSTHYCYAKETDDIDRFIVENEENCGANPIAAWMCGSNILECRLGGSTTRYRGWLEVVLRSPSTRKRRLVRLAGRASLSDPELPSSLWDGFPGQSSVQNTEHGNNGVPSFPPRSDKESQTLATARSLIERCDATLASLGLESKTLLPRTETAASHDTGSDSVQPAQNTDILHSSNRSNTASSMSPSTPTPATPTELSESRNTVSKVLDQGHLGSTPKTGDVAAVSSGDRATLPELAGAEQEAESHPRSVRYWLHSLFEDSANVRGIEEQLRLLGFSDDMILNGSTHQGRGDTFHRYSPMRRLQAGPNLDRAIAILDRTTTLHTHKIALLYAGPASSGSSDIKDEMDLSFEDLILRATQGSDAFREFTQGLSNIVMARHLKYFSGGIDTSDFAADGTWAAVWIEDENSSVASSKTMVLFHLVTLMPGGLNNRKRHVGNDNVHIVYVEQGYSFHPEIESWGQVGDQNELQSAVVSGEFGFVTIFVEQNLNLVRVTVRIRAGLPKETKAALRNLTGTFVVAKAVAPDYVRRVAIRADLACCSVMEDRLGLASNWEERRKQIRDMDRYLETE